MARPGISICAGVVSRAHFTARLQDGPPYARPMAQIDDPRHQAQLPLRLTVMTTRANGTELSARDSVQILKSSYEFPPLGGGGAKVVMGIARRLAARGHHVDVVTMAFRGLAARD